MSDLELYPFKSRYFKRGDWKMHYVDEGSGDPVVMVHGNPTWSFYYRNLIKGLRGDHRVVAPDHIGCGLSDKPSEAEYPYDMASRVDDLDALLDHLDIQENVTLIVHDWGGMIGMACAVRRPERIKRLVILNTGAFRLPKDKPFPWQLKLARSFLGAFCVRRLNLFCRGALRTCVVRRRMPPEVEAAYVGPYDSWENRVAVHRFVVDIPLSPGDPGYDMILEVEKGLEQFRKIPALVCWGLQDFVFDAAFLREWKRRLPEAEYHEFSDAGHYVLEDAGDEILGFVRSFMEKNPVSAVVG